MGESDIKGGDKFRVITEFTRKFMNADEKEVSLIVKPGKIFEVMPRVPKFKTVVVHLRSARDGYQSFVACKVEPSEGMFQDEHGQYFGWILLDHLEKMQDTHTCRCDINMLLSVGCRCGGK